MVHVPYRGGGPAVTDLIAGQVQVKFASTSPTIEYIRAGTLRALAVTTATRSEALPDIPAVAEFMPGYEATFWRESARRKIRPPRSSTNSIERLELFSLIPALRLVLPIWASFR
jgi:tripartite-type tricarboxylate transporter receptor subunit TctC